jgi:Raf kinase inhibitor-like YbhB/YbcL family protein
MTLQSPAFADGEAMPPRFSREGEDLPPPLEWDGVPVGTAELVLELTDPDAPRGAFVHWIAAGLDPRLDRYDPERPPLRVEGRNGWGEVGYGGPRPPAGDPPHRYVFTLYALAEPSALPPGASHVDLVDALRAKVLSEARLVARFAR